MKYLNFIISFVCLLYLIGCSASYKELSNMEEIKASNFQEYLVNEYKKKAQFEAEKMHDWNSAKLYSEKALRSLKTEDIYPEKLESWELPKDKILEIEIAYKNLMLVYDKAKIIDPLNLAVAISSIDCWSEQQEENWQTWDINKCKDDFLNSMHNIYEKISITENTKNTKDEKIQNELKDEVTIVTKDKNYELKQIIYFDFDKFNLSDVSKRKVELFLNKHNNEIKEYIVIGHTDTKGAKSYNLSLSIKRAKIVQDLLIAQGIDKSKIKVFGRGEESLAIFTPDNTRQPANRRVEIKKAN